MNPLQRILAAATLAAAGVACLLKAWATIYTPPREFLGVRIASSVEWSRLPMGWLLGGIAAIGAALFVWASGRKG
jgi:hypothetical protein